MTTEVFKITRVRKQEQILQEEELGFLSKFIVQADHDMIEVNLECGCSGVSMFLKPDEYAKIVDTKTVSINSSGWWNTLTSPKVMIFSESGEQVFPYKALPWL